MKEKNILVTLLTAAVRGRRWLDEQGWRSKAFSHKVAGGLIFTWLALPPIVLLANGWPNGWEFDPTCHQRAAIAAAIGFGLALLAALLDRLGDPRSNSALRPATPRRGART